MGIIFKINLAIVSLGIGALAVFGFPVRLCHTRTPQTESAFAARDIEILFTD